MLAVLEVEIPDSRMLSSQDVWLSEPASGAPLDIAMAYLESKAADLGVRPSDIDNAVIKNFYTDQDTGISHIYLRQRLVDLEIQHADLSIHVSRDGRIIAASSSFVALPENAEFSTIPSIDPVDAAMWAMHHLEIEPMAGPIWFDYKSAEIEDTHSESDSMRIQSALVDIPGLSLTNIPVQLMWIPSRSGDVKLAWEMNIQTTDTEHWYDLAVDGHTGDVFMIGDWVEHASYHVLPIPIEHPQDGPFQSVVDPHTPALAASPFGWHDIDGIDGPEFTTTVGNNVVAHLDRNGDNVPDTASRPDGGSNLVFNFAFDATLTPQQNANVAVTNLFYWNNVLHDVHQLYGFTPAAGNFQTNNYGQGGLENDAVQADGQDNASGGSANNANFATPPDGSAPRMQMYEFNQTTPRRDSDLDNGIITHEYGHGVTNRLTGGPANANALNALQSGGMGEGWSDWWTLMFRQTSASDTSTSRGVGMYVLGQADSALGIRQYRYGFNIADSAFETFSNFGVGSGQSTLVHAVGTRWASTLWDLNHLLIEKYGYEPDIYLSSRATGSNIAGNILALRLVMDALKLQPANPSFIQARDAILAADTALTGGQNQREIWVAFARRGLGFGASTASSGSNALTTSFNLPPLYAEMQIASTNPQIGSFVSTPPTTFTVNFSREYMPSSVDASDFLVNATPATAFNFVDGDTIEFTYASSPVTAQGLQAMSMNAGSILTNDDASQITAFNATFSYDAIAIQAIEVSPNSGSIVPLGSTLTLDLNFNEPVNPTSIATSNLNVNIGSVASAIALDADTVRYTIGNLSSEGTLNVSLPLGRISDVFGNRNRTAFASTYVVDRTVAGFPTSTAAKLPLGSLVYETSSNGIIGQAGDIDSFTIHLDGRQTVSVLMSPLITTLTPSILIFDPAGLPLAVATASAPGSTTAVQLATANLSGIYRLDVSGLNNTLGAYSVRLVLNASIEAEEATQVANNSAPTAESINLAAASLSTSFVEATRFAVAGISDTSNSQTPASASPVSPNLTDISTTGTRSTTAIGDDATQTLSATDLAGFSFPFFGTIYSSLSFSTNGLITFGGSSTDYANTNLSLSPSLASIAVLWDDLNIDNTGTGSASRAIYWQVLGSGQNQQLIVQWNNVRILGGSTYFTMQAVLSKNGLIQINYGNSVLSSVVTGATVGIKAPGTNNPSRLLMHFNQAASTLVGPGLSTLITPISTPDFYRVDLVGGELFTVTSSSSTTSAVLNMQLLNTDGNSVLATGSSTATNLGTSISNFVVPASGSYFVRISANARANYTLVATRQAVFDAEPNESSSLAQPLGGGNSALGSLESSNDQDWYSFSVPNAGTRIRVESRTPSDGPGEFLNSLDPKLELYDPNGVLIASGISLADGRNEFIYVPSAASTGTYRIRVSASGSTNGEYFVGVLNALPTSINNRQVFYNNASGFGTSGPNNAPNVNPLNAIDTTKSVLLPGETATASHYTNYDRGINGLVIDIVNLTSKEVASLDLSNLQFDIWNNFTSDNATPNFVPLNVSATLSTFDSGGKDGSARIKLTFPDQAIQNAWLRVTVLATPATGLAANSVFYIGNARYDVTGPSGNVVAINVFDVSRTRAAIPLSDGSPSNAFDVDRNGTVNVFDVNRVRAAIGTVERSLVLFSAPTSGGTLNREELTAGLSMLDDQVKRFQSSKISKDLLPPNSDLEPLDQFFVSLGNLS